MTWFLIVWIAGFDVGMNTGIVTSPTMSREMIAVPSEEICQQIAAANKYMRLECWAKREPAAPIGGTGNGTLDLFSFHPAPGFSQPAPHEMPNMQLNSEGH